MNWEQIQGQWKQLKGKLKMKWGKLTDDDLDFIAGQKDVLVGSADVDPDMMHGVTRQRLQFDAHAAAFGDDVIGLHQLGPPHLDDRRDALRER